MFVKKVIIMLSSLLLSMDTIAHESMMAVSLNGYPCDKGMVLMDADSCVAKYSGTAMSGEINWSLCMKDTMGNVVWEKELETKENGETSFVIKPELFNIYFYDEDLKSVSYFNSQGDILQNGSIRLTVNDEEMEWPVTFMILPSEGIILDIANVKGPYQVEDIQQEMDKHPFWYADIKTQQRRCRSIALYLQSPYFPFRFCLNCIDNPDEITVHKDMDLQIGDKLQLLTWNKYGGHYSPWQFEFKESDVPTNIFVEEEDGISIRSQESGFMVCGKDVAGVAIYDSGGRIVSQTDGGGFTRLDAGKGVFVVKVKQKSGKTLVRKFMRQ